MRNSGGLRKAAHQYGRNGDPRGIRYDLLPAARFQGKDLQLVGVAVDQPSEDEAAGHTGDQNIAIERLAEIVGLKHVAPDFIAGTVVADAR